MNAISLPIVLAAIVKASVILAATALVAAALRRASASARHFVWTLGLVSALAAPVLSMALPRWELPIVRVAATVPQAEWFPPSGGRLPNRSHEAATSRPVSSASPILPAEAGSHSEGPATLT